MAVSTTCRMGLLLGQIRPIAISLLNLMYSGGVVALKRNGGMEINLHGVQIYEMFSSFFVL